MVIFSIISTSYIYAFVIEDISGFEGSMEEDVDDIEAINAHFIFRIVHKPKKIKIEFSKFSNADFTFYHEGFIPPMLSKVYVLQQAFLDYE